MVKVDEADKVAAEDKANARRSHTTCRTKCKCKVDVATTVVSQLHQEVQAGIVGQPAAQAEAFLNLTKAFANWNVCFTCGFDIEDRHTLVTCPCLWRKPHHQNPGNFFLCIPLVLGFHTALMYACALFQLNPSWWFGLRHKRGHVTNVCPSSMSNLHV